MLLFDHYPREELEELLLDSPEELEELEEELVFPASVDEDDSDDPPEELEDDECPVELDEELVSSAAVEEEDEDSRKSECIEPTHAMHSRCAFTLSFPPAGIVQPACPALSAAVSAAVEPSQRLLRISFSAFGSDESHFGLPPSCFLLSHSGLMFISPMNE